MGGDRRDPGTAAGGDVFFRDQAYALPRWRGIWELALRPLRLVPRSLRVEAGPMLGVFCFAMTLYALTAPRKVALEDDGLFLMNLHFFGVNHPPGYPLYTLLGSPFYHLLPDFLSPAFRGHLFSGFAGAVACAALYLVVAMLVRSRMCAFLAGLAYAVSEAFWSQAIIAEVYTLNAAMYFILLAMCLRYATWEGERSPSHRRLYVLIAFTYGLGMSNHWPLLGLGSVGLLGVVASQWRELYRNAHFGVLALAVGLFPYVWLVVRSRMNVEVSFYGGIDSLRELLFYVARTGYSGVDKQASVGWEEKWAFTQFFLTQWGGQITWAGLLLAACGFVAMLFSRIHAWLAVVLFVSWFMTGPLLIYLVDFQTEFIWFAAFRVYHLLCYGITAIFFAYGLAWLGKQCQDMLKDPLRAQAVAGGLGGLVVVTATFVNWQANDRSDYTWAHDLAMFKLVSVEPGTRLFTFDDLDLPVGYLRMVEKVRTDVTVYNDQGLVFGNRIYSPFDGDSKKNLLISNFIKQVDPSPVYYHPYRTELFDTGGNGSDFLGFWRRVHRGGNAQRVVLSESFRLWLENNLDVGELSTDRWTKQQAAGTIATLVSAVYQAALGGHTFSPEWERVIALAREKNDLARLFLLWNRSHQGLMTEEEAKEEIAWIDGMFELDREVVFDNANWADMLTLKAVLLLQFPRLAKEDLGEEIESALHLALEYEFKFDAFKILVDLLRGQERDDEALAILKDRFPVISNAPNNVRVLYNKMIKERSSGTRQWQVIVLPKDAG